MPNVIFHTAISFILVLFFLIVPYFVPLSTAMGVLMIFLTVFSSYGLGYWLVELTHRWKNEIRDRREKRFTWYNKMGLLESAYLIELKIATGYSKNYWRLFFK